ncbi:MAG: VapC toxin family PIN domain ribonuclease, partial [Roseiflexus castenholzii]
IPIPCDHPAWSPRAARGVVRDPLRFLAAFTLSEAKGSE